MEKKTIYIGLAGYSGQKFDVAEATRLIKAAFDQISALFPDRPIALVSGLTNLGIPALGYALATERGWYTIGVACAKAKDYECYPCTETHIVGTDWGHESQTFLDMCQIFIRVGGGDQTITEITKAKEMGKPVIEHCLAALPKE